MKLALIMCVVLCACKATGVLKKYEAAPGSTYTIYNKTYPINTLTIEGKFINTYSDSNLINGKIGVGNITWVFRKEPKGTKTYFIDTMPPIMNPAYVAIRYDFVVNNQPPIISILSAPKIGETVEVSRKNGKLTLISKGVTMTDGSLLSFNVTQK